MSILQTMPWTDPYWFGNEFGDIAGKLVAGPDGTMGRYQLDGSGSYKQHWFTPAEVAQLVPGQKYTVSLSVAGVGGKALCHVATLHAGGYYSQQQSFEVADGAYTVIEWTFVYSTADLGVDIRNFSGYYYDKVGHPATGIRIGPLTLTPAGAAAPAPSPAPAPAPAPSPAPSPAPTPTPVGGDQSAYLQHCIDTDTPIPAGIYEFATALRMPRHGDALVGAGKLPPRQQARDYGVILRYTGTGDAVVVGESQHYISNVEISGVRIEAAGGSSCIRAYNPATSVFKDLSLIGPGANEACLHVSGGIQSVFENIDFCGMGIPEFNPHGDFSLRADGIVFENGTDENGLSTTYTAHRVTRCYAHQCARGIVNYSGLVTVDGQTVLEDNLVALYIGDTGRTMVNGAYWESNGTPIYMGDHSYLSLINAEIGSGYAQCFIDAGRYLQISIIGGFLKGPAALLGKRAQPHSEGSHAVIMGAALPTGMDIGQAVIVGPDMRGAGR